jgi:hypothetical protein
MKTHYPKLILAATALAVAGMFAVPALTTAGPQASSDAGQSLVQHVTAKKKDLPGKGGKKKAAPGKGAKKDPPGKGGKKL